VDKKSENLFQGLERLPTLMIVVTREPMQYKLYQQIDFFHALEKSE
jgi:hypothetical protein